MSEHLTDDSLELYVYSEKFDKDCARCSRQSYLKDDDESDHPDGRRHLLDKHPDSPYDVSELEAYLYYLGIRGRTPSALQWGPKLIFRTSKDVFKAPVRRRPRVTRLRPVYEHHKLGKDDLWATIRSKVVELLDQRNIQFSSIDLVRFSWVEDYYTDKELESLRQYGDTLVLVSVGHSSVVTSPITIWVGVLPDTLTGEVAFYSSNDILNLLKEYDISDIEVAYRESVVRGFSGPELFAPVSYSDPLKAVIDPVTTALSLSIAELKTLKSEGTMGFYFKLGEDLYGVTARHVLFPEDQGNNEYSYVAGPKKQVVLMGTQAFNNLLTSIQSHIHALNFEVGILEEQVMALTTSSEGHGRKTRQAADSLVKTQDKLRKTRTAIEELKKFFVKIKRDWKKPQDRVIGHVVWAPPFSVSTPPDNYTKDVCVIKLDKNKFSQNFKGNVLDLGPEIEFSTFIAAMYSPPFIFEYPFDDRLLELRGILSAEEIRTPDNIDSKFRDPMRYVIKRGLTTLTTIGCLNGFDSYVRRYFAIGSRDSVEVAVHPYGIDRDESSYLSEKLNFGPFSRLGDSGSIIVDRLGKFVALLTSATGQRTTSDITFGSPMYWLWEVIEAQFPGAKLICEDDDT